MASVGLLLCTANPKPHSADRKSLL